MQFFDVTIFNAFQCWKMENSLNILCLRNYEDMEGIRIVSSLINTLVFLPIKT